MESAIVVSSASAAVSLASFFVSLNSFLRDRGRLDVKIGVYDQLSADTLERLGGVVTISIVNSGRRSVIITDLGFEGPGSWWRKPLHRLAPNFIKPTGTTIFGPKLYPLLYDKTGEFKVLSEGQRSSVNLPFKTQSDFKEWQKMLSTSRAFYISDTTDRRHHASGRTFRKLKTDVQEWIDGDVE